MTRSCSIFLVFCQLVVMVGCGSTAVQETTSSEGGNESRDAQTADVEKDPKPKIKVGESIPSFEVDIGDKTLTVDALRQDRSLTKDGTFVFTFWCSHCHSCRVTEKDLDELARKYRGEVGVVAIDSSAEDTVERIEAFAKKQGLQIPIAVDYDGAAAQACGVRVTTTTLVIDKDGIVRYFGQFKDSENQYAINALEAVLSGKPVGVGYTKQKG